MGSGLRYRVLEKGILACFRTILNWTLFDETTGFNFLSEVLTVMSGLREWSLSMCYAGAEGIWEGYGILKHFKVGYEINIDTFAGV